MVNKNRYGVTEYGGGEGLPQRNQEIETKPEKLLRNGEAARVTRQAGVNGDWDGSEQIRPASVNRKKALEVSTNDYYASPQVGGEQLQ